MKLCTKNTLKIIFLPFFFFLFIFFHSLFFIFFFIFVFIIEYCNPLFCYTGFVIFEKKNMIFVYVWLIKCEMIFVSLVIEKINII